MPEKYLPSLTLYIQKKILLYSLQCLHNIAYEIFNLNDLLLFTSQLKRKFYRVHQHPFSNIR